MDMKRTIIIGDVHGCLKELNALLDRLMPFHPGDRVISLGDMLDKGPDSVGVVRRLMGIGTELVLGNHEEKLLRYLAHEKRIADFRAANPKSQAPKNPMEPGKLQSYLDAFTAEELDYLASAKTYIDLVRHNAIVVHGGIAPDLKALPTTEAIGLKGKDKSIVGKMIRTRYVSKDSGKMLPIGEQGPEDPFWADVYDGRFGSVFFGHDPLIDTIRSFPYAMGLDTGCVFGGCLTAAVIDEEGEVNCASVKAFEKYAESMYTE